MKKVFHLSSCSTCKRIIKDINWPDDIQFQNIKEDPISTTDLKAIMELAESYESLFSRRAMKYKSMGLKEMNLNEKDYKKYLLEEYTFLKRPVIIYDEFISIGNSKKVVEGLKDFFS